MTTLSPLTTGTLTIKQLADYTALRICAQTCVDRGNDNSDLEGHLECGDSKILNSCFCRQDLRPKASTFLSSCIVTRCKYNNQDVTSAWSLYDGYCSFTVKSGSAKTTTKLSTTSSTKTPVAPSLSTTPDLPLASSTTHATTSSNPTSQSVFPALSASTGSTVTSGGARPTDTTYGGSSPLPSTTIAAIAIGSVAAVLLILALLTWKCGWAQIKSRRAGDAHAEENQAPFGFGGAMTKSEGSRSPESFDLGMMAVKSTSENTYRDTFPLVQQPVELCDTGFRAELSAGDEVYYQKG
ncbi:hypothetical protein B0T18DRAFT_412454 [Schizothecium vesticola]|uniref:Extracellular membrane protein CFEM domain-containing protein n=1 Tax=Schizothecium vesticola TaxID=314040 RepID=A0AA40EWW6_9PEZI|nr:hypothetical protein B0T18DRAFT_412454 [Schizothecium vesticola]